MYLSGYLKQLLKREGGVEAPHNYCKRRGIKKIRADRNFYKNHWSFPILHVQTSSCGDSIMLLEVKFSQSDNLI